MNKNFLCGLRAKAAVLFLAILMAVSLSFPVFASTSADINLEYLKSVIDMVMDRYNGEITERQLIEGALKGIFNVMDDYTTYYTMEEAQEFLTDIEGVYEGIGVVLEKADEGVAIIKVFDSSPAQKAGLLAGDIIVKIGGRNARDMSLTEAANLIKGERGTKVTLGIKRPGTNIIMLIEVERDIVEINPVTYQIREGDIGYIKIESFNGNAEKYVRQALEDMDSRGITKLILDIRDNPGGEVTQAVNIASNFVPAGVITTLKFKSEKTQDIVYYSYLDGKKYDLAILVNENTASASEILAGAVQDTGSGILVGTNTYGKALVQHLIPILTPEAFEKYKRQYNADVVDAYELIIEHNIVPLNSEVMGWTKITTGVYITPNGTVLDENGLKPNYYVRRIKPASNSIIETITRLQAMEVFSLNGRGAEVYSAESILDALGYIVDAPDMVLDIKTIWAIREFQIDEGLQVNGLLDVSTQEALNKKLDHLLRRNDPQYEKAVELLNREL